MRTGKTSNNVSSYLDVSEFIIREPSPLIKPSPTPLPIALESYNLIATPEIRPIDHQPSEFFLTPLHKTLISEEIQDLAGEFFLEEHKSAALNKRQSILKTRHRRQDPSENNLLQLLKLQCEFEDFISENENSLSVIEESEDSYFDSDDDIDSRIERSLRKSLDKDESEKGNFEQRQSTIDLSQVDYTETIEKFTRNPKEEIIKTIKEIEQRRDLQDQLEKKNIIKQFLSKYLIQFQMHCYEQSWRSLTGNLSQAISGIVNTLEHTFSKSVGLISFEERRIKLLKYLQKKKRRIWRKKVSYDCRKKVADGRLRIKGKFVTREQACEQLGLESLEHYSAEEIKQMLQRKLDNSLIQPLDG